MSDVATRIRLAWGCTLLIWPGAILRRTGHPDAGRPARWVLRALGARHVVQAIATARRADWAELGVAADALHATTAIGLAAASARWRRAALLDGLIAAGFAAMNGRALMQSSSKAGADGLTCAQRARI